MSEHDEQVALFEWALLLESQVLQLENLYAVPNGGKRPRGEAGKLKAEGVKAGVLDVNLDWPSKVYHGLRIEMKYGKNTTTPEQKEWIARLRRAGYYPVVCYSAEEAAYEILRYLGYDPGPIQKGMMPVMSD